MPRKYNIKVNIVYAQQEDGTWDATARHRSRALSVYGYGEKWEARRAITAMAEKLSWVLHEPKP